MAERGLLPDGIVRLGIRTLLHDRLRAEARRFRDREAALAAFIAEMRAGEIAPHASAANAQHYEVPAAFFACVLGCHMKYSTGLWQGAEALDDAEAAMLSVTCERARIADGQRILDLGCGWGSFALHVAERFPRSRVTALSNSISQHAFVLGRARERGLSNLEVVTANVNAFRSTDRYDRVVSVETLQHLRNWPELLRRIRRWLAPGGRLFVHVPAHRAYAYPFEVGAEGDWMARHFFTGGMMPSDDLLPRVAGADFALEERWIVPGTHCARTAEAWHARLVANRERAVAALAQGGAGSAEVRFQRWRLFFMACAELFGFAGGTEWFVSHYRLRAAELGP